MNRTINRRGGTLLAGIAALAFVAYANAGQTVVSVTQVRPQQPSPSGEAVWALPTIRAYWMNRYVDPASGRLMHGAHWLYAKEEDGRWVLRPPTSQPAMRGKPGPARRSRGFREDRPGLQAQELSAEVSRMREENRKAVESNAAAAAAVTTITATAQELSASAKGAQASLAGVEAMRSELKELREEVARLKKGSK